MEAFGIDGLDKAHIPVFNVKIFIFHFPNGFGCQISGIPECEDGNILPWPEIITALPILISRKGCCQSV